MLTGQLGAATNADAQELFVGSYDRTTLRGASVIKSAPCDAPGAEMRTPFVF